MKMRWLLVACILIVSAAAQAEDAPVRSLFLSADDVALAEQKAAEEARPGRAEIALDAIMYYGPDEWAVWLMGRKRSPDNRLDAPAISAVTADHVVLTVKGEDGEADQTIILRAGESYQLADGSVRKIQRPVER